MSINTLYGRPVWIGIDPGARWTGIVARDGTRLLGSTVIDRHKVEPDTDRPGGATMEAITEAVGLLADPATARIAVEDAIAPNPHVRRRDGNSLTNPHAIIDTARIVGYLQCAFPEIVLVRPGGNGSQALTSYPRALVTDREWANAIRAHRLLESAPSNPPQCHARSAWDCAGTAATEARITEGRRRLEAHRAAHANEPATRHRRRTS